MQKYRFIILSIFVLIASCTLDDDSTTQVGFDSLSAEELLPSAIQQVAYNHSSIGARTAAVIMQYVQGLNVFVEDYDLDASYFNLLWSEGYYTGSLISLEEIGKLQDTDDALKAISLILKVHEFAHLTFYFGDIPFSESVKGDDFPKPNYDSQAEVLSKLIDMLDTSIELLENESFAENLVSYDWLFEGDLLRWKKMAYGLKARILYNQGISNSETLQLILSSIDNSFTSSIEQANFVFNNGVDNPQFTFETQRPSTNSAGRSFQKFLEESQDPRMSQIMTDVGNVQWEYFLANDFVTQWFMQNATIPLLSYTELLFIKTDVLHSQGASPNTVQTALIGAIESSMLDYGYQLGIDTGVELVGYISAQSSLNGLSADEIEERIMEQAYIAYYGFNYQQAWNNYRRTGYPRLESTAFRPNENNPSNSIPQRFLYPLSERELNTANVSDAIVRQNGALLDEPLPVFK